MILKVTGIEELVDRVVSIIGDNLAQVWICGDLAKGMESDTLEAVLIGNQLDNDYILELLQKVQEVIGKSIRYSIDSEIVHTQKETVFLFGKPINHQSINEEKSSHSFRIL